MTDLDRSQQEILKAARDFAKGEFDRDQALELERDGIFPAKIWAKAGELGFIGLHLPETYGGGGLGFFEAALVTEAFCRQESTTGCALLLAGFGAECLWRSGGEALKARYLPAVAQARLRTAAAFSEPGVGSGFSSLQTTARREGDAWIINGLKAHVLNAAHADLFIVLCRTDDDQRSMIAVERNSAGLTLEDQGRRLGANMTGSAQVRFSDVRAPVDHIVGRSGQGAALLTHFNDDAAVLLSAAATGIAAGALDRAQAYVKERAAFGRKIGAFEIIRHNIADMAAQVESARAIVRQAARRHDAGKSGTLAAVAKLVADRAAVAVADQAVQLYGGYGYMRESEVERFYRDAKALQLMLGGPGAMKNKIAEATIGRKTGKEESKKV
ncbi:acyl-CoA dehydrogenase family protein [Desulfatitalea tepidiphila]|uniref:acyl-CoA dehydrogenase family protein n=1 Tax=Desulfatitalea tepidiphila TaxID=1185843 RepID=UPI0006B40310|nr:acyl-CoA dehydrogenase family protein [Desulfatitalea tepidiphila]